MSTDCASIIEQRREKLEWFAVQVRSRSEWIVAAALRVKGFEACLPLARPPFRAKSRVKEIALFPGYLFCRFEREALLPIVTVPHVASVVSFGRTPQAIDPVEMEAIQRLAASGLFSESHDYLRIGHRIRVCSGPLEGVEGILVREKGHDRVVLSISLLRRSVTAEVDRYRIEAIDPATEHQQPTRLLQYSKSA